MHATPMRMKTVPWECTVCGELFGWSKSGPIVALLNHRRLAHPDCPMCRTATTDGLCPRCHARYELVGERV